MPPLDRPQDCGAPEIDQLPDLEKWSEILSLFSQVIGSGIVFLDTHGTKILTATRQSSHCVEIGSAGKPGDILRSDCVFHVLPHLRESQETFYACPHALHYSAVEICHQGVPVAVIVLGPILVGRRESDQVYRAMCSRLGLDADRFLDSIRDAKVYSYTVVRSMLVFLREMTQYYLHMNYQCSQLRQLVPNLLTDPEKFAGAVYTEELANHLLGVGMQLVQADTGSVLFYDDKESCFWVKTAHGMDPAFFKQGRSYLRDGIAGWAALRGKPVLIDRHSILPDLEGRLKRSQLAASMLIPLEYGKKIFGVLCLNALSNNLFFNKDSLLRLNQLCKLAAAALTRAEIPAV